MPTYEEVLSLAKRLPLSDRVRLLAALEAIVPHSVAVEGTDEMISAEELLESEAALQDYRSGQDAGISSAALKQRLFGGNH